MKQLTVDGIAGPICTVAVEERCSVKWLKEAIEKESGISFDEQQLLQGCTELRDEDDLESLTQVTMLRRSKEKVELLRRIESCEEKKSVLFLLRTAPEILRSDREVILSAVRKNGLALRFASPPLTAQKDIVMAAVSQCGRALPFAAEELREDCELTIAAARASPDEVSEFLPSKLAGDKETMLAIVRMRGQHLALADEKLRSDRDVVLSALSHDVLAFRFSGEELRRDESLILSAIAKKPAAFVFAAEELKQDRRFVQLALREQPEVKRFLLPED